MIDIGQLGRQLLETVVVLNEKGVGSDRVKKALECLRSVAQNNLPLNKKIVQNILQALVHHYHQYSARRISEIELISPNRSPDVVDQQLLILFCTTLQHFMKKYLKMVNLYQEKDTIIILLSDCLQETKKRLKQLLYQNLQLVLLLVETVKDRGRQLIEKILPHTISILFSIILEDKMQKKMKQTALTAITTAIDCYFSGQPSKSPFLKIVHTKIGQYLDLLIENSNKLPSVSSFCQMLFKYQIPTFFGQLCHLSVLHDVKLQLPSDYSKYEASSSLKYQIQKNMKMLSRNISTQKKCNILTFIQKSLKYVTFHKQQEKQLMDQFMLCLKPSFDQKVRLNIEHQTVQIQSAEIFDKQKYDKLQIEYESVRINMLLNTFKFFQKNSQIVHKFEKIFKNSNFNMQQQLEQMPYDIVMPVSTLLQYSSLLYLISLTCSSVSIFNIIRNSQPVRILKPTTEQEQLIQCLSLQIVLNCYRKQEPKPMSSNKIQTLETLFLLLCQDVYSLKLLGIKQLLFMSIPVNIGEFLIGYIPTLINRNKRNIEFVTQLVRLTITSMSSGIAHKIAKEYCALKNVEEMMMLVVPKVPTDMARMCILRITDGNGWIQALFRSARYLTKVGMKHLDKDMAFSTNDKENVVISDSLGVIVLEIGAKWNGELRGRRVGRVLELMNYLYDINKDMVFFKRLHEMFQNFKQIMSDFVQYSDSYSKLLVLDRLAILIDRYYKQNNNKIIDLRQGLQRVEKAIVIDTEVEHRKKKEEVKATIVRILKTLQK